jgi:hypothetical protein
MSEQSKVDFREELLLVSLATDPEENRNPTRLRKAARIALRAERLDDDHGLVARAFLRLLNRRVIRLVEDRSGVEVNYNSEDSIWDRLAS